MNYTVYKLDFTTGVHFGNGALNDSNPTFKADTLFSALCIEAVKLGKTEIFCGLVRDGRLLFSDALPYIGAHYMIPKPILRLEVKNSGDSVLKKKMKKIKYLPVESLEDFLAGTYLDKTIELPELGHSEMQTMTSIRNEKGEADPFHVGTYYFEKGNGLYVIIGYEEAEALEVVIELLESLSYTGVGGKRSGGLGKFELRCAGKTESLLKRLSQRCDRRSMTLSVALPREEELETALEGATYLLEKRSGFVLSEQDTETNRKKKDLYVFAAGSCFERSFQGDLYDVGNGAGHPVYRYAKPMFMEVSV